MEIYHTSPPAALSTGINNSLAHLPDQISSGKSKITGRIQYTHPG
jgi:hypothetical protein